MRPSFLFYIVSNCEVTIKQKWILRGYTEDPDLGLVCVYTRNAGQGSVLPMKIHKFFVVNLLLTLKKAAVKNNYDKNFMNLRW